jgi:MoaA/NifB/PqqE/SkfB family radical SAM enzyme
MLKKLFSLGSHTVRPPLPKVSDHHAPLAREVMEAYNKARPEGSKPLFCYVPFNNMSFSFKGRVLACAYNQKVELGRYPDQGVRDMWFNSEAGNRLREHMEHNDLSYGCKHCRYFAEHHKFSGLKPLVFDKYHEMKEVQYPQVMEFELSSTCNFECVMCNGEVSSSVRKNRDQLPALKSPYDAAFVDQLEEFIPHLKEAKFYGGEPFLIPIYFEIWERMLKLNPGIRFFVITNGSVLTDRVKTLIDRGDFDIAVSIDSVKKDQLESIRRNVRHTELLDNINWFNRYCNTRGKNLVLSFTIMRINWRDFPDMIRFCNSIDAALYVSYLKFPPAFALWNLPAAELREIREELVGLNLPEDNYAQRNNAQCYRDLITFLENAEKESLTRDSDELIPTSATHGRDYLDLIPSRFSIASAAETGQSGETDEQNHLSESELLDAVRSAYADEEWQMVWQKLSAALDSMGSEANHGRIYQSLLRTPSRQVLNDLSAMTINDLREQLKTFAVAI